jgi:MSHA biogenesis protein MshE
MDMGAPGFLIAASLQAIVAQRLVRRVCEFCASPCEITSPQKLWLDSVCGAGAADLQAVQGAGCQNCNNTGYRGRIGVYELLEPDPAMLTALRSNDSVAFTEAVRNNKSFKPMRYSALEYIRQGITTVEELMRITSERSEDELNLPELLEQSGVEPHKFPE